MLILLISLLLPRATLAEVRVTDDLGRTVALQQPARRVIALYSALAEIAVALGKADALVARTAADALPELAGKPSVGTHMRPNLELVVGARPELVLQLSGRDEALEPVRRLEELGIPVAVFRIATFDDLFAVTRRLGQLLGAEDAAKALESGWQGRLAAVETAVAAAPRPSVAFEIRSPDLLLAGKDSLVDEMIRRAGGRNAVTAPGRLARLSDEALLALAPEVYLMQRGPMNPNPAPLAQRRLFADLPAATSGRGFVVEEERYSRPGPASVAAVEELARLLHPECFTAAPSAGGRP